MTAQVVSAANLAAARSRGLIPQQLADEMEVSRASVLRAESRYALHLLRKSPSRLRTFLDEVEQLRPIEANGILREIILQIFGQWDHMIYAPEWCACNLAAQERRLAALLLQHEGRVVPRPIIDAALYTAESDVPAYNYVSVLLVRIRQKAGHLLQVSSVKCIGWRAERMPGVTFSWENDC